MPNFDAKTEARTLQSALLMAEQHTLSDGGSHVAGKLYDEVTKEYCRLSETDKKATVKALKESTVVEVLQNGLGEDVFAKTSGRFNNIFMALKCDVKRTIFEQISDF